MSRLKLFIPLVLFLSLTLVFAWVLLDSDYDPQSLPSALVGKPVPEFSLPRLDTGALLSNQDLPKKPYLLNVWATWCPSCRHEHPYLLKLAEQGVIIIGLDYKDEDAKAKQWLQALGDPYRFNIVDRHGSLGLDLGVYGAPETYVVAADGLIKYKHVGVVDETVWRDKLAQFF